MAASGCQLLSDQFQGVAETAQEPVAISLMDEVEALRNRPAWLSGIARKKLIQFPDFQMTLRRMRPGARIPEHYNPGRICIQNVFGRIRMHAAGKTFDLSPGECLVLDRAVPHDVEALEESAFLLTIAHRPDSIG